MKKLTEGGKPSKKNISKEDIVKMKVYQYMYNVCWSKINNLIDKNK